ncbi:unnamed protein product [Amoebophrya sp. A25]|nr:unnamed protein product [Amoebophrya sp. A25]|eukprot:GSA25T00007112001.1
MMPTRSQSMSSLQAANDIKAAHNAKVRDIRMGLYQSQTPSGKVFHHVGSFTPMQEMKMPQDARTGHVGPWRSYGTWWQSLQKADEKEKNIFHDDQTATRFWPLGKNVQKVHGSLEPEHYFMGYRQRAAGTDGAKGELKQSSNSLWMVKNSLVEKVADPPTRRTEK